MTLIRIEKEIGGRTLTLETGRIARQANAAVLATYGQTTVLATVVRAAPRPGADFFPLTVDYREKLSAAGKFPGGFRKREGAPNEKEILTMRMIDRPLRPLFPDGFMDEVQVQVFVMSHDTQNDSDILAGVAASAALALSDCPFEGPTATVRVGRIDEQFVINPTHAQLEYSDLDIVLAGHKDGINMIEIGAAEVPDADVLAGMKFGYDHILQIISAINELCAKAAKPKIMGDLVLPSADIVNLVNSRLKESVRQARQISGKQERSAKLDEILKAFLAESCPEVTNGNYNDFMAREKKVTAIKQAFNRLDEIVAREMILNHGFRTGGRGLKQIRPLEMEVGIFARTHGSAFFQRGETQSLVSCTLGSVRDEQIVDGLIPEYSKKFTLHYNFPPFCTGEVKRITGPGRREIGHGALAERSLLGVLPAPDEFPYTIRIVSDITESNGSSSMASVCGGCLALMDAGVPIKNIVAGISVGRVSDDSGKQVFITDIIGEEDFYGDMDFKVSGTRDGVTGVQLDLKIRGLTLAQIETTFAQALEGRLFLIDEMQKCISAPRSDLAPHAPRIVTLRIDPEKIGKLIGPGGKTIRAIQEKTGAAIDVEDDGTVFICTSDGNAMAEARAEVEALCAEIKVGSVYKGKVVSIKDFGCFVEIVPGTDGMCHISELSDGFLKNVHDKVRLGDDLMVKVLAVDDNGKIRLSHKAYLRDQAPKPTV